MSKMQHPQRPGPSGAPSDTRAQQKLFEDRWSGYGDQIGIKRFANQLSATDLKKLAIFRDFDADFLAKISHDVSIAVWEKGSVLFEEGSYLDLAFFIVSGHVVVSIDQHRREAARPIFNSTYLVRPGEEAEVRAEAEAGQPPPPAPPPTRRGGTPAITFLTSMDVDLPRGGTLRLGPGELFGEIGSLNGWPQSVTARVASEATLLQIRLPALRELKKHSQALKEHLDTLYRERTLLTQLAMTPLFRHVDDAFIGELAKRVDLVSCSPGDRVVEEGAPVEALYLVRSGFLKLVQTIGAEEATVSYLSKGTTLGEIELLIDGIEGARFTAESVGFTELVRIEKADLEVLVEQYPGVLRQLWDNTVMRIKDAGFTKRHLEKADLIDFSLANGLVQGNSMLLIDLDVCTRCDDCVTGCANTHEGRPRFVREGEKYGNFLIARSCYHCEDPVCLIGCPTGAIRRTNVAEVVAIEDDLCIGCSNCARKCPYDAIVMHETGETWSESAMPDWLRGRPRMVASKCDLCYTSETGPACVNSCPHSCAFRIGSLDEFQSLLALEAGAP